MTVEADIFTTLAGHLAGMTSPWPIAWPNIDFTPPDNGRYYRVSFQPNDVETRQLDRGGYVYRGLLQVTVVVREGEGDPLALREASRIARRFEYLTEFSVAGGRLVISRMPSVRGALIGGGNNEVPVVITYELTAD